MTFEEFTISLQSENPPEGINPLLLALWYDAKGGWEKSHNIIQDIDSRDAALIHAYLHRKEGDIGNANYWYRRGGMQRPVYGLNEEWKKMVEKLLSSIEFK